MKSSHIVLFLVLTVVLSACTNPFAKKKAGLKVVTNIPSEVSIDGTSSGKTPLENKSLEVKKYELKLTPDNSSQEPFEGSVKLHAGFETTIEWVFSDTKEASSGYIFEYEDAQNKAKAELQITATPDNVPVSIDGENVGFTPLLIDKLEAGTHTVTLAAPGYQEVNKQVLLVKGKRVLMTAKLARTAVDTLLLPPEASQSGELASPAPATGSAKTTPTPKATPKTTPKPSATPVATSSTQASSSGTITTVKKTTTTKPYVEILTTPTNFLRVRELASTTSKEVYRLAVGSTVPFANASSSGWIKITYDGTLQGWVSDQYAKLVK